MSPIVERIRGVQEFLCRQPHLTEFGIKCRPSLDDGFRWMAWCHWESDTRRRASFGSGGDELMAWLMLQTTVEQGD